MRRGRAAGRQRGAVAVNYEALDDQQLLQRICGQEKDALNALYTRYASPVYSLAMNMLKQPPLAEEVTQDVFLNIWLKAASFRPDRGQPRSWIMSVAHHRIIDVIRARRRAVVMTDPADYEMLEALPARDASVETQVTQNLERERIRQALDTLPESQRQVVEMAYFQGYSQSEMAELLGQPLGTVKTRVRLALQKLRTALQDDAIES